MLFQEELTGAFYEVVLRGRSCKCFPYYQSLSIDEDNSPNEVLWRFLVVLQTLHSLPKAKSSREKLNTSHPQSPMFTCLLIVLIAPLVLLPRALVRFFPVPLGQSQGHRSSYPPPHINSINQHVDEKQTRDEYYLNYGEFL